MLTEELSKRLERQQSMAPKVIYGFDNSYEYLLNLSGNVRLSERRENACTKFAGKLLESDRFSHLFPLNDYPEDMVNLRSTKIYKEFHARTVRLYNSPLYSIRRRINELLEA